MLFEVKKQNIPSTVLHEKYIVPPFSVFNTHQTYWRERQKMWQDIGIGGTNGRITSNNGLTYDNRRMDKHARAHKEFNGTSAFSPVLSEVMYKWYTIPGGTVFDPFSGGITRGIVAAMLGHEYTGMDINPVQVESNFEEYDKLCEKYNISGNATWKVGNSCDCTKIPCTKFDMILTCPPYYNLEKYTDLPGDLSNCTDYTYFIPQYAEAIENCYLLLRDDSFMVWVVSDVRDKKTTEYYGLVADTIKIAQTVGFKFYNEIILYNDTGNLAIVSGNYLDKARKVGRQHQNVLVFYRGDKSQIKGKFGDVI